MKRYWMVAVTIAFATIAQFIGRSSVGADNVYINPVVVAQNTSTPVPTFTRTPTPSLTPHFIASATRAQQVPETPAPTWTAPPPDRAVEVPDHYEMQRPIEEDRTNWVDRTYPYGGTASGRFAVHHGVEFVNPRFTPIVAVADGTVIFAGMDDSRQIGPQRNFYGNVVIIQHIFRAPDDEPVFSLYGHMQDIDVRTGQMVVQGLQIGRVGDSGVALGPHLHFEVRVGDPFSYDATRNPELWIFPFPSFGTIAGRVTDVDGEYLQFVTLRVQSIDISRFAVTYAEGPINSDPVIGENFTLGDLPANYYHVLVSNNNGRVLFRRLVYVYPNRTTWVEVQLES